MTMGLPRVLRHQVLQQGWVLLLLRVLCWATPLIQDYPRVCGPWKRSSRPPLDLLLLWADGHFRRYYRCVLGLGYWYVGPQGLLSESLGCLQSLLRPPGVSLVPVLPMGFSSGQMGLDQLLSCLKVRLLGLGFGVVPAGVFGLTNPDN